MSEAAILELLTSFEATIRLAARNLSIARALAEAHRSGLHPPDGILDAYLATIDRDDAQLARFREQGQRIRHDARLATS